MIIKVFNNKIENIRKLENCIFLIPQQIMFKDYKMDTHIYQIITNKCPYHVYIMYTHTHTRTHINCIQLKSTGLYSGVKLHI